MLKIWMVNIITWIDQGGNVILAPVLNPIYNTKRWGSEDETISSVVGKLSKFDGKAKRSEQFINWLFWCLTGEKYHCRNKIEINVNSPYMTT